MTTLSALYLWRSGILACPPDMDYKHLLSPYHYECGPLVLALCVTDPHHVCGTEKSSSAYTFQVTARQLAFLEEYVTNGSPHISPVSL